jgi:hypothetical protein
VTAVPLALLQSYHSQTGTMGADGRLQNDFKKGKQK